MRTDHFVGHWDPPEPYQQTARRGRTTDWRPRAQRMRAEPGGSRGNEPEEKQEVGRPGDGASQVHLLHGRGVKGVRRTTQWWWVREKDKSLLKKPGEELASSGSTPAGGLPHGGVCLQWKEGSRKQ